MTKLAILWHMHQPYYEDLASGEHILPWVRLHATKDYYGMVALLEEFPRVRVTFNLVPSLLIQIQAFAEDRAKDRHLAIGLKPADTLDADERRFLVANGFHAAVEHMIRRFPYYFALYGRRSSPDTFDTADLRDLQIWHKLVWIDPDWLATDLRLRKLVEKGSHFSEDDKSTLRDIELELLKRVIPAYRTAAERGQIELSTSPFYHPILPLLCDTDVHFRAHPESALPRGVFRWPSDASLQLDRAFRLHASLFGSRPRGVWPSEGSVSGEAIALIAESGCEWIATDEAILARSIDRAVTAESLYRPYEVFATCEPRQSKRPIRCLFRDHGLSDLIGFSYQGWASGAAAEDFVRRVRDAGRRFTEATGGGDAVVTVILDGENAWEHYPNGGRAFLRELYRRLEEAADIQTVTMSEAAAGGAEALNTVYPGSWINSDFYIWAGHADDHRAWSQLADARRMYDVHATNVSVDARERALEELLIVEGSDWFWWYGDDHSSDQDRDFDDLFRRHLRNVYVALGLVTPDGLFVSNITTESMVSLLRPAVWLTPAIDGEVTGFSEWIGALSAYLAGGGGTMQRVSSQLVRQVFVGIGPLHIFVRIDGAGLVSGLARRQCGLALLTAGSNPRRVGLWPAPAPDIQIAVGAIVEAAVPHRLLVDGGPTEGDPPGDARLQFSLLVTDSGNHVIEQHPAGDPIEIDGVGENIELLNWRV